MPSPLKVVPKKIVPARTPSGIFTSSVELADAPIPAKVDLSSASILLHGPRKVGKTKFLNEFPDSYFIDFDTGGSFYKMRKTPCSTWEDYLRTLDLLEAKGRGYAENYILDTGYLMYERCFEYMVRKLELTDIRDEGWGNGWKAIEREFRAQNNRLLPLGGYRVVCHTDTTEIKLRNGNTITRHNLQLSKQAYKWFAGFVDVIGYFTYDAFGNRIIRIRGDLELEAGVRTDDFSEGGHFYYSDGSPVISIPAGGSSKEAYRNFLLAFENKLINPVKGGLENITTRKQLPTKK